MVNIIATSDFLNAIDTGRIDEADANFTPFSHQDVVDNLSTALDFGTITPISLSSTRFEFETSFGSYDYEMVFTGAGLGPVNSFAALEAAFDAGLATGAFSNLTIRGEKAASFPGDTSLPLATIMTLDVSASGYTLRTGSYELQVNGSLPVSMSDFFDLGDTLDQLENFGSLNNAQQNAVIADLNAYGLDDFSFSVDGTEILGLHASASQVSLTVLGYSFNLHGDFPEDFGEALEMLVEVADFLDFGTPLTFSNIAGFSIDRLTVTDPDGDVVMRTTGNWGNTNNISVDTVRLDGVTVVNSIVGENQDNRDFFQPGDMLIGTNGSDHIIGLAGNDILAGEGGRDYLFGGSGDDRLDGGSGSDILNPGDNDRSYDVIIGSRGNDRIIYSDNDNGFQEIDYSGLSGPLTVMIDGGTNTASVHKSGGAGTDTIVDVNKAIQAWGFEIIGTAGADVFTADGADSYGESNYIGLRGGRGADEFNVTTTGQVRLSFNWDGTNEATSGARVNVKAGVVQNDGFGFSDTLNVTYRGSGMLELRGTELNDRLLGGNGTDRFILDQGNDFADGKGGSDMVRYDRSGVDAVNVDLATGTATGLWDGFSFTHTLRNIENIRGSRDDGDTLSGNNAANKIEGRGGNDSISGRGGHDLLKGESGDDILNGGNGRDILNGGTGEDVLNGGGGVDTASYEDASGRVRADLGRSANNTGEAAGDTYIKVENLIGGDDRDVLAGNGKANMIDGGRGVDRIDGRGGNDVLKGGGGNDLIIGGAGNDEMTGNNGRDTFVFNSGADVITDFNNDRLRVDDALWTGNLSKAQVLALASVVNGDTVFDFGGGNTLTLEDYTDIAGLNPLLSIF